MEKINFVNNEAPYLSAENLNQMQDNIENAISGVVESGSNSNGSWIKYADGTMIIRQKYIDPQAITSVSMGSLYRVGLDVPPDFPVPFVGEVPEVSITLTNCWLGWLMGIELETTLTNATGGNFVPLASATNKTFQNVVINIIAIGRWK